MKFQNRHSVVKKTPGQLHGDCYIGQTLLDMYLKVSRRSGKQDINNTNGNEVVI